MIKVCGMRDAENIRDVESLGIDLMGFIFWPRSSRYVAERPAYLPTHCKRVGVFVNATHEEIQRRQEAFGFDMVKTAKNVLVLEIKWSKGLLIPEYLTLVCGIFSIHKARWKNMPIQPVSFRTWH